MEDDLIFFKLRQPQFVFKWKKTSIFLCMEDTFKIKQKQAGAELCQAHIKLGLVSCWLEDCGL